MPPQVRTADAGTPVNSQAPVSTEQTKPAEVDKNAVQKQEPPKQDAQTAAKNAEAAKQHAGGRKQQNVADERRVRNELDQKVRDKKTDNAVNHSHPQGLEETTRKKQLEIERKMEEIEKTKGQKQVPAKVGTAYAASEFAADAAKASKAVGGKNAGKTEKKPDHKTSNRESDGLWETMKQAGKVVVNMPTVAGAAADAALESGGDAIRRQKLENLAQRKHPQDIVPGQMFEVEDIHHISHAVRDKPGDKNINKIGVQKNTEVVASRAGTIKLGGQELDVGPPIPKWVDHPRQYRNATQAEMEEHLKELSGGGPLTNFEKTLASEFGPKQLRVTPIKEAGFKGGEISKEVQAYKVKEGGGADYETKYYDRNGNVLKDMGMRGGSVESEGLGPIEYLGYAQLGKHVVTKVAGKIFAKKEAETIVKAEIGAAARNETGAAARSAEQQAATQPRQTNIDVGHANTQPVPAQRPVQGRPYDDTHPIQDTARTPTRQPSQSTPASQQTKNTTGGGSDSGGKGPVESKELQKGEYIRQRPIENRPSIPDSDPITITTATGRSQMTVGQYRSKVGQAKEWISQQMRKNPGWNHDFTGLNKQAAEKFGLDKDWAGLNNPYTYGKL